MIEKTWRFVERNLWLLLTFYALASVLYYLHKDNDQFAWTNFWIAALCYTIWTKDREITRQKAHAERWRQRLAHVQNTRP